MYIAHICTICVFFFILTTIKKWHFIKLFVSGIQHNDDIMSVPFKNNTTGVTSGAGTVYPFIFCLLFCPFSVGHCIVYVCSNCGFWLPLLVYNRILSCYDFGLVHFHNNVWHSSIHEGFRYNYQKFQMTKKDESTELFL